jgi:nitrogen fixation/metabolism regulation signal transduction histidine kinase
MPAWLRVVFFTALGLAGLSLFVLAATSSDSKLFERWFPVLLIINQAIAAALFVVVSAMAFRLIQNVRNRVFGAKMTARLALTVAGMVLIPCALIYFVSSVFISRSIDSWFDVRVEKALDSGVTITRSFFSSGSGGLFLLVFFSHHFLLRRPDQLRGRLQQRLSYRLPKILFHDDD